MSRKSKNSLGDKKRLSDVVPRGFNPAKSNTSVKNRPSTSKERECNIIEVGVLSDTLTTMLAPNGHESLASLAGIISKLRYEFDPSAITMSSTNISDAINRLSAVLSDTANAAQRVFTLANKHESLLQRMALLTSAFGESNVASGASPQTVAEFISKHHLLEEEAKRVMHEIVVAQGFQDICGQNINKVIKLINTLNTELRELFCRLNLSISEECLNGSVDSNTDLDQAHADEIFNSFEN